MKKGSKGGSNIEGYILELCDKYDVPDETEIDFEQIQRDAEKYEVDAEKEQLRIKKREFRMLEDKAKQLQAVQSELEGWSADSKRRASDAGIVEAVEQLRERYENSLEGLKK